MEEYVVYVLYSKSYFKRYVGYTSNLIERFKSHNTLSKKGYTVRFRPWYVIHIEVFYDKKQAMEREFFFKSGIGRKWLDENISMEI
jgi:putative endonuclease